MPRWREIWQYLTRPAASLQAEEQRQQASLLAALSMALLLVGIIIVNFWVLANSDFKAAPYISIGIISAIVLTYFLSRTRYYRIGAFLLATMLFPIVGVIISTAPGPMTERMIALNFLVVAILLASIFLILRGTLLIGGICIIATTLFFFVPGVPFAVTYSYVVFEAVMLALLIVATIIRNNTLHARQEAEEALRESELRFRRVVEYSPDAMIIHQDWNIIFANEALARLMGTDTPSVFVGKPAASLVRPENGHILEERIRRLYAGQSLPLSEQVYVRQDGTLIDVEVAASPLMLEGKPAALVTVRDITERKQAEEARQKLEAQLLQAQKMEAVGRLAGGIAHDFNNILVPIIGYTELGLTNLSPQEKLYADLQRVRAAAERAAGLTRQILAFSRKQVLFMRMVDLNALVMDFQGMLQRLIGEDIEVRTSLELALYPVKADKGQIEQVLLNLAVNARDAMPNGGQLTLETNNVYLDEAYIKRYGEAQPPGHYVMLAVSDTGQGMDAETQQHIFEPFFTTKEQGKGTGLGLATVFGIVKQHGGNIWVYSEPGKGTTIKIYLPQAEETMPLAPEKITSRVSVLGTETVLVVEDEEMVRKLVCETLAAHGYKIIEAQNPTDGLRLAAEYKETIHLLLTDVIMPKMNGQELGQNVTVIHPSIKVLYMSGYTEHVIAQRGILDEGVNFVQKPFTVQTLIQKVRQVLHG